MPASATRRGRVEPLRYYRSVKLQYRHLPSRFKKHATDWTRANKWPGTHADALLMALNAIAN
jgi:hypothetical protein